MDLSMSLLGWVHTLASIVAMASGAWVIVTPKGTARHRKLGDTFVASLLIACVLSLGIYTRHAWTAAHWFAVFGIVTAGGGFLVGRFKQPRFGWRYLHLTLMLLAYYDLMGGLVNEVFLHVTALRHFWRDGIQVIGMTQGVVMLAFVILLVGFIVATAIGQLRLRSRAKREAVA